MEKCPRCGAAELEYGELMVRGTGWTLVFTPRAGFWSSLFVRRKRLRASACLSCGHVELCLDVAARQTEEAFQEGRKKGE